MRTWKGQGSFSSSPPSPAAIRRPGSEESGLVGRHTQAAPRPITGLLTGSASRSLSCGADLSRSVPCDLARKASAHAGSRLPPWPVVGGTPIVRSPWTRGTSNPSRRAALWADEPGVPGRVGDSRRLYYSDGLVGRRGNWADETARWETEADHSDQKHHLAKVRVAGSNPVFRSHEVPGQA